MCFTGHLRRSAQYDNDHQDDSSTGTRTQRTSQENREHLAKKAKVKKEWMKAAKAKEKQEKRDKQLIEHEKRQRQRVQRHGSSGGSFYLGEDTDGCDDVHLGNSSDRVSTTKVLAIFKEVVSETEVRHIKPILVPVGAMQVVVISRWLRNRAALPSLDRTEIADARKRCMGSAQMEYN